MMSGNDRMSLAIVDRKRQTM